MAARTGSFGVLDRKSNASRKRGLNRRRTRIALGRRDEDVLLRHVGDGPDDRQHVVELLHADFALDDGDAVLAGLLGVPERGDRAAEQQQRLGDVPPGGLEAPLVPVPRPAEQRAHVFLEHGEGRVGEPGLKAGGLGHEHRRPPRRFQIGDVLHRHDRPFVDQAVKAGGMDASGARRVDSQAARVFEAVEQRDDVGGRGRLRIIPQPGKAGAAQFGIDRQQASRARPARRRSARPPGPRRPSSGRAPAPPAQSVPTPSPWEAARCSPANGRASPGRSARRGPWPRRHPRRPAGRRANRRGRSCGDRRYF